MFGLIYWLLVGGTLTIGKIKNISENNYFKNKAIRDREKGKNRANVYRDTCGYYKDINTGAKRVIWPDKNGNVWVEDVNGNKLKNLTEEKEQELWKEKIKERPKNKAVEYTLWDKKTSQVRDGAFAATGHVFKDVNNHQLYFKRNIIWNPETNYMDNYNKPRVIATFYMRVNDGKLECLADDWEEYGFSGIPFATPEQVDSFIDFFNKKQEQGGWIRHKRYKGWNEDEKTRIDDFYLTDLGRYRF